MESFERNWKNQQPRKNLNILVLGDSGVGKSSIVQQFCSPKSKDPVDPTIAVDYQLKEYKNLIINIWDVSGNAYFKSIREKFYEEISVFLLVYDLSNRKSFESLDQWIDEIESNLKSTSRQGICANKLDLLGNRQVPEAEGSMFAAMKDFAHFEVSALNGQGVKDMFDRLIF